MLLSIVVPTVGRTSEIRRLLYSIEPLIKEDIEVIIVDQNPAGYLDSSIPDTLKDNIQVFRIDEKGVSNARNVGLREAKGEFVNFCDDDAIVQSQFVESVRKAFEEHSESAMVSFRVFDLEEDIDCMIPFPIQDCEIRKSNFHKVSIEVAQVWRTSRLRELRGYDPMMGVGSPFGAEEGKDLIIRAFSAGMKMYYVPETCFRHPTKMDAPLKRYFSYAEGTAALLVKHWKKGYVWSHVLIFLAKSIIGVLLYNFWSLPDCKRYSMRLLGFGSGVLKKGKVSLSLFNAKVM